MKKTTKRITKKRIKKKNHFYSGHSHVTVLNYGEDIGQRKACYFEQHLIRKRGIREWHNYGAVVSQKKQTG